MNKKQRLIVVGLMASLLTISVVILGSGPAQLFSPTPTCSYGWGPYIGKDIPNLTNAWKEVISATDLEVKDARVQGVGETSLIICGSKTKQSWEMAYQQIQATIIVDDVKNLDILGNIMVKVYRAVKILTTNEDSLAMAKANLSILFVSRKEQNEVMRRSCNYNQAIIMIGQGKSGKELFEATCGE